MIWPWIMTLTLKKKIVSCSLGFGLYPAYKVSILSDATTLTFDLDKQYTV
jgi:hypothetical protein